MVIQQYTTIFYPQEELTMKKYECEVCGYIYDEAVEGVKFEDLPEDWVCPLCGVPKSSFVKVEEK